MKKADVFVNNVKAGVFTEIVFQSEYEFTYEAEYHGNPVSLTLPVETKKYTFKSFPSVFEGLLPEGVQLEAILRDKKINRRDLFTQLLECGGDCIGAVSIRKTT